MTIELEPNIEVAAEKPTRTRQRKAVGMPDYVKIVLEENDAIPPTGQFFGLNGKSYLLRPGVDVEVPQGIIDILDNAVMEVALQDPATKQILGYRRRMRYPYRRITTE